MTKWDKLMTLSEYRFRNPRTGSESKREYNIEKAGRHFLKKSERTE
jgi:hypothetical protein